MSATLQDVICKCISLKKFVFQFKFHSLKLVPKVPVDWKSTFMQEIDWWGHACVHSCNYLVITVLFKLYEPFDAMISREKMHMCLANKWPRIGHHVLVNYVPYMFISAQ